METSELLALIDGKRRKAKRDYRPYSDGSIMAWRAKGYIEALREIEAAIKSGGADEGGSPEGE